MSRKADRARVELGQGAAVPQPPVDADMAESGALLLCLAAQLLSEGRAGSAVFLPQLQRPILLPLSRRLEGVLKAGWWLGFVTQLAALCWERSVTAFCVT